MKRILAILMFVLIGCGGIVFAGQNSNSSTTMEPNHMGNMHGRRGRRYNRRWHRRHRRHRHMHNKNANMG
jgi:hypothetical protein